MKYGCIGEHLKHSFSKEIHELIADYDYKIKEIASDKLDDFLVKKDFVAINVTIPYKERVIPHLSFIDEHAKLIGAVNTVVNKDGNLYGYNTDFFGMNKLLEHAKVEVKDKKVAILGTGGTAKTAIAVTKYLGAKSVLVVSRLAGDGKITYDELLSKHLDTQVIINTTPCGMYPNNYSSPLDLSRFVNLTGVIDAIYNPLRTNLVSQAISLGVTAEGGLYMLVAQAVRACEIFLEKKFPIEIIDNTFKKILSQKQNVVLIGMPSSGKSTVGEIIAKLLDREFIDTDREIVKQCGEIKEIFNNYGEKAFRDIESNVIKEVAPSTCKVIATGGGAILRQENINALKQNGIVYFIDRPLEKLIPTSDRPLSVDKKSIEKLYSERYSIYNSVCDKKINAESSPQEVANEIIGDFTK